MAHLICKDHERRVQVVSETASTFHRGGDRSACKSVLLEYREYIFTPAMVALIKLPLWEMVHLALFEDWIDG